MANVKAAAIITAGGAGKRFGGEGLPKQFTPLSGKPLIAYSIESFESSDLISEIVLVVPEELVEHSQVEIVDKFKFTKVSKIIPGGYERQQSVEKGVWAIGSNPEVVAVHDGVRPFVTTALIDEVVKESLLSGAAIAAVPSSDTIKKSTNSQSIESTLPRENIWLAQTPQAFRYDIIRQAFESAAQDSYIGTDEASLVERLGVEVTLVQASKYNIKITTPEDIRLGELIVKSEIFRNK